MVDVIGDKKSHPSVDATLLKVLLEQNLEVLIQVVEWWASIQRLPCPALLRSLWVGQFGGWEVREVLNQEVAILSGSLNSKSALAGTFDADICARGEALLLALVVVLILQLLTVSGSNAVFGRNTHISVLCPALVDGALGVGSTRLCVNELVDIIVIYSAILHFLIGHAVIEVSGREGNADLLVAESSGQDNFLVAWLVLNL